MHYSKKPRFLWILLLLILTELAASAGAFHFTVTADQRGAVTAYDHLYAQMKEKLGGQGAFQVSPGDLDPPEKIRAKIDARFGKNAAWFPCLGNHDATPEYAQWFRDEYNKGHSGRKPLSARTNRDGPAGCRETNYSWGYGNAHFIVINEYWRGGAGKGSDIEGRGGDISDALYKWLVQDLKKNRKPVIFIFGHEPAFPKVRHINDSLDRSPAHRDRFWKLLESNPSVKAYICGHTHFYARMQRPGGRVWHIDAGNAGNDGGDGKTFLNITVSGDKVKFDAWRDRGTGEYSIGDSWAVPLTADDGKS